MVRVMPSGSVCWISAIFLYTAFATFTVLLPLCFCSLIYTPGVPLMYT